MSASFQGVSGQSFANSLVPAEQLYPNFDLLSKTFCPTAKRGQSNLQCIIDNIYQTDHVSTTLKYMDFILILL